MKLAHGLPSRLINGLGFVSTALVPINPGLIPARWVGLPIVPFGAAVGLLAAGLGTCAVARNRTAAALFLLLFAGVFALSTFVYPTQARHTGVIFLFLIGIEWLLVDRGQGPISTLSRAWIAVLAVLGVWMSAWALAVPFTAMGDVERAIDRRGIADVEWAVYPSPIGVEISARLNRPYYDAQQQCLAWFQKWNAASVRSLTPDELAARLKTAAASSGGRLMLLTTEEFDDTPGLRLVEAFEMRLLPEPARIYEVTAPAVAAAAAPLPLCE
jgi:hypothetical protein